MRAGGGQRGILRVHAGRCQSLPAPAGILGPLALPAHQDLGRTATGGKAAPGAVAARLAFAGRLGIAARGLGLALCPDHVCVGTQPLGIALRNPG